MFSEAVPFRLLRSCAAHAKIRTIAQRVDGRDAATAESHLFRINVSIHAPQGKTFMRSTAPLLILVLVFAPTARDAATLAGEADLPRPTSEQAAWQDLELGLFYHFDISVFTDGGEGDWPHQGHLDSSLYNPVKLSTDQWLEAAIDHVISMEQITEGERIRQYVLEGLVGDSWTELARGQSIGHKRIDRFAPVAVTKVRLRATESVAEPVIRKLAVYHVASSAGPKPAAAKPSGWGVRQVLVGEPTLPRVLLIGDSILNQSADHRAEPDRRQSHGGEPSHGC